jgi:hypothetical protein
MLWTYIRPVDKWKRSEIPKINPNIFINGFLTKWLKLYSRESIPSSVKCAGKTG